MQCLKPHPHGLLLKVRVQPRASCNRIAGLHVDALKVSLTAPPVDGAANQACLKFLAKSLQLPRSSLEILSGHTSRTKRILIGREAENADPAAQQRVEARLKSLLS
jgi:uncharacterized protein